jgi:hypothetical protein
MAPSIRPLVLTLMLQFYRGVLDGTHVYIAGRNLLAYTPFQSADTRISLAPGIGHVQDAYVYKGKLYITNWSLNTWGLAQVGSGLPLTTSPQTVTEVWPKSFLEFPDTINFFEQNSVEYMYISDENVYEVRKMKYTTGWAEMYRTT